MFQYPSEMRSATGKLMLSAHSRTSPSTRWRSLSLRLIPRSRRTPWDRTKLAPTEMGLRAVWFMNPRPPYLWGRLRMSLAMARRSLLSVRLRSLTHDMTVRKMMSSKCCTPTAPTRGGRVRKRWLRVGTKQRRRRISFCWSVRVVLIASMRSSRSWAASMVRRDPRDRSSLGPPTHDPNTAVPSSIIRRWVRYQDLGRLTPRPYSSLNAGRSR